MGVDGHDLVLWAKDSGCVALWSLLLSRVNVLLTCGLLVVDGSVCWLMLTEQKGNSQKGTLYFTRINAFPMEMQPHMTNQLNFEQMLASRVMFLFFLILKSMQPTSSHPLLIVAYASRVIPWRLSLQFGVFLNSAQS